MFEHVVIKAGHSTREKIVGHLVNSVILMADRAIALGKMPVDDYDVLTAGRPEASLATPV